MLPEIGRRAGNLDDPRGGGGRLRHRRRRHPDRARPQPQRPQSVRKPVRTEVCSGKCGRSSTAGEPAASRRDDVPAPCHPWPWRFSASTPPLAFGDLGPRPALCTSAPMTQAGPGPRRRRADAEKGVCGGRGPFVARHRSPPRDVRRLRPTFCQARHENTFRGFFLPSALFTIIDRCCRHAAPPESPWSRRARLRAPAAREMWRRELTCAGSPWNRGCWIGSGDSAERPGRVLHPGRRAADGAVALLKTAGIDVAVVDGPRRRSPRDYWITVPAVTFWSRTSGCAPGSIHIRFFRFDTIHLMRIFLNAKIHQRHRHRREHPITSVP